MAAQINMPTANYVTTNIDLPSYLSYWPRLKTLNDIGKYVEVRKRVDLLMSIKYDGYSVESRRRIETPEFYKQLKTALR